MKKTKLAFFSLVLSSLAIVACGETSGNNGGGNGDKKCKHKYGAAEVVTPATETAKGSQTKTCTLCGYVKTEDIPMLPPSFDVTVKDATGATISSKKYAYGTQIEKPADPTAPAGKVFYGWINKANGGQIWNFDKEDVNKVAENTTLEPLFVDNYATRYLEAELCPVITEVVYEYDKDGNIVYETDNDGNVVYEKNADGTEKVDEAGNKIPKKKILRNGLDGATYSGGAKGQQLIKKDFDSTYSSTCNIDPFYYYKDANSDIQICDETHEGAKKIDPVGENYGYFVHFNYEPGNTLTWNITSSKAVTGASIFGRFSAEYGLQRHVNSEIDELYSTFTSEMVKVKVNGTVVDYGTITIHHIVDKEFITFEDFYLGNINLNAGANKVELVVDNEVSQNGTIKSTCPCIDSLKIITDADITWDEAKLSNVVIL